MSKTKKIFLAAVAALLLVAVSVGGTLAYLTATTTPVTNTFSPANITITLTETWNADSATDDDNVNDHWEAKLVPNATYPKDPKVTVLEGSEKCYVFIEVLETNIQGVVNYSVDETKWTLVANAVPKHTGAKVYISKNVIDASAEDKEITILTNNQVTIAEGFAGGSASASLGFYAYAVQSEHLKSSAPIDVWGLVPTPTT